MTKTYLGLFGALSAVALLAAGCDEAKYPASENTQAVEAPVEQPAYQAEAGAQVGSGFDLATAEGREAAKSALGEGWHEIEDGGHVWQASNVADMTLAIPPGKEREATIYISSFLPKPGQTVDVDVSLDEEELQNYSLENGAPDAVVKLDFPPSEVTHLADSRSASPKTQDFLRPRSGGEGLCKFRAFHHLQKFPPWQRLALDKLPPHALR